MFCRNVLIYFGRETQHTAMRVLDGLLAPGGTLFVGPAETGLMMREGMASAKLALAFAFRRADGETPAFGEVRGRGEQDPGSRALYAAIASAQKEMGLPPPSAPPRAATAGVNRAVAKVVAKVVADSLAPSAGSGINAGRSFGIPINNSPQQATLTIAPAPVPDQQCTLLQARALADTGALLEAAAVARAYLKAYPASADAYYLLGVIADAQGEQAEARSHYKRALYLDPAHGEALTHLAAVLGLEGDRAGARLLLARAERASGGRNE